MNQRLTCGRLAAVSLLLFATAAHAVSEDDFLKPVGLPPKAAPDAANWRLCPAAAAGHTAAAFRENVLPVVHPDRQGDLGSLP